MNETASPRHPFKALVAVAAMFTIVHGVGARADTGDDAPAHADIVGPLLHEACPHVDDSEPAD